MLCQLFPLINQLSIQGLQQAASIAVVPLRRKEKFQEPRIQLLDDFIPQYADEVTLLMSVVLVKFKTDQVFNFFLDSYRIWDKHASVIQLNAQSLEDQKFWREQNIINYEINSSTPE